VVSDPSAARRVFLTGAVTRRITYLGDPAAAWHSVRSDLPRSGLPRASAAVASRARVPVPPPPPADPFAAPSRCFGLPSPNLPAKLLDVLTAPGCRTPRRTLVAALRPALELYPGLAQTLGSAMAVLGFMLASVPPSLILITGFLCPWRSARA